MMYILIEKFYIIIILHIFSYNSIKIKLSKYIIFYKIIYFLKIKLIIYSIIIIFI